MKIYEFVTLLLVATVITSASVMATPARVYVDPTVRLVDQNNMGWNAKDLQEALTQAGLEQYNVKAIRVRDLPPGGWERNTRVTVWPGGYVEVRAEDMDVYQFVRALQPHLNALTDDKQYATAYPRRR